MSHILSEAAAAERRRLKRSQLQEQLRQLDEEEQQSASQDYARSAQTHEQSYHSSGPSGSGGWNDNDAYNHSRYYSGEPSSYPSYSRSGQPDPPTQPRNGGYASQYPEYNDRSSGRDPYQSTSGNTVPTSVSAVYRSRQDPTLPAPAKTAATSMQHTPVPSREQVNDYLVQHMNYPRGLAMGWNIEGIRFDVYELFSAVIRAGGSSTVSSRELWPILATHLKIPAVASSNGIRSSTQSAHTLRDFFLQDLGGLEILWDQTKGPTNPRSGSGTDHPPISQDARRTVLNAQTRQSPTASTFQQSQGRHPVHQAYQQTQSQLSQSSANRLNSTSTQSQSRPLASMSDSSATRAQAVAPLSASSQSQQQPNSALSYWQNQYYGSSRQQQSNEAVTSQPAIPSSRLQQPYATSERYTSQTIGTQQPTSSYRTTQASHRSNMPTTVSPADLRLQPIQPIRLPPIHDAPQSAPSSQPPSPLMVTVQPPDEFTQPEIDPSHSQKKKRIRNPKAPQYDENGVLIATPRKRTPKEPQLDENGQVVIVPRVKKRKPPQLDENGQVIVRPRGRPPRPLEYDENGVLITTPRKRKSRAKLRADGMVSTGADAAATDRQGVTQPTGPLLPSTSTSTNIPPTALTSTSIQNEPSDIPSAKTFDELVLSGIMPLPRPGPGTETDPSHGLIRQYAARCQELRVAVKRARQDEESRVVTPSEIVFWNRLVFMLKRNPAVVIPGSDYFDQHPERAGPVPDEAQYNTILGGGSRSDPTGSQSNRDSAKKAGRPKYPRDENGKVNRPPPRLNPDGTPIMRKKKKQAPLNGEIINGEGASNSQALNEDGTPVSRINRKRPRPTEGEGGDSDGNGERKKRGRGRIRRTGNGTDNAFGISSEFDTEPKRPKVPKIKAPTVAAGTVVDAVAGGSAPVAGDGVSAEDGSHAVQLASTESQPGSGIPEATLATAIEAAQAASANLAATVSQPTSTPIPVSTTQNAISGIGKMMSVIPLSMLGKFPSKPPKQPKQKAGPIPRPVHFISSKRPVEALLGALSGYSTPSKIISLSSGPGIEAKLRRADVTAFSPKKFNVPATIVMPVTTRMARGTGRPRGRPPGRRNATAGPSRLVPRVLRPVTPPQPEDDWHIGPDNGPDTEANVGPSGNSTRRRMTLEAVEITSLPRSQLSRFVASQVETPTRAGPSRTTALARVATGSSATPYTLVRRVTRTTAAEPTSVAGPSTLPIPRRGRTRATTIDEPPASLPLARTRRSRLSDTVANESQEEPHSAGPSRRALRSQRSPSSQLLDSEPRRKRVRLATSSPVPARTPSPRRTRNSLPAPLAQPKKAIKPSRTVMSRRGMRYVTRARRPVQRVPITGQPRTRPMRTRPQPVPKLAARSSTTKRPVPRAIAVSPSPSPSPEPEYSLEGRGIPVVEIILRRKRKVVQPRVEGMPVNRMRVVLPISRKWRAELISQGYYDPFRDDDSEDDEYEQRKAYSGLRPMKISRISKAYNARPIQPEPVPLRFLIRAGPGIIEPWKPVLNEDTLLLRAAEHECGWKGCDAVLGSEDLLKRHVTIRGHAAQGQFRGGPQGNQILHRCHWYGCEEPCFEQEAGLVQHIVARHVSRVLACPYEGCELSSPTVNHLVRHVMKHHDSPDDAPRPFADLSARLSPTSPVPDVPLPTAARTDELTTPAIAPSIYRSVARNEWVRSKVHDRCFGGENPIMHVLHPPHMLQHIDDPDIVPANDLPLIEVDAETEEATDFDRDLELAVAEALGEIDEEQNIAAQGLHAEEATWEDDVGMEEDDNDREFRLAVEELAEEARREQQELAEEDPSADRNTGDEGLLLDLGESEQAGMDGEVDGDISDIDSSALAGLTAEPSPFEQNVELPIELELDMMVDEQVVASLDPRLNDEVDLEVVEVDTAKSAEIENTRVPVPDGLATSDVAEPMTSTGSATADFTTTEPDANGHASPMLDGYLSNDIATVNTDATQHLNGGQGIEKSVSPNFSNLAIPSVLEGEQETGLSNDDGKVEDAIAPVSVHSTIRLTLLPLQSMS